MKLITFQSFEAFAFLKKHGYLICDEKYINLEKSGATYEWVLEKMNKQVKNNTNSKYPIWAWVKCYNGICPAKRKGEPVKGYDIKITFNKNEEEVFITDFRRYSFLLNNIYIPDTLKDKIEFDNLLEKYNITEDELKAYVRADKYGAHRTDKEYLQVCNIIRKSFDKCITKDSDILQGCVWKIDLDEIESIEVLSDTNYRYGSLNYIRSTGKRINWQDDLYKRLK